MADLVRQLPHGQRIPSLDGLRALSISLVLGAHALAETGSAWTFLWNGGLGVLVFFVISGFLITTLLLAERDRTGRIDLKRFYVRRAFRLLPVVAVFLCVMGGLSAAGLLPTPTRNLLAVLLFVRNYIGNGWFTGHFWSLSVEEQFYIFWPVFVLLFARRKSLLIAILLIAAAPLFRYIGYITVGSEFHVARIFNNGTSIVLHVDALMMGCVLGIVRSGRGKLVERVANQRPALFRLVCFVTMLSVGAARGLVDGGIAAAFGTTVQALCATYLVASYTTVRTGWSYQLLNWPLLTWVGTLSYSLYIWQQLFLFPPITGTRWAALLPEAWLARLVLAFAAAAVSYYGIEQPMLRVRDQVGRKARVSFPA
jgi:peptidoglycan/LPS O-acetylase OafA/YrhL